MNHTHRCDACAAVVAGADLQAFGDAYIAHVRSEHPDWPFPDLAIRNVAEATQRLTGSTERLDTIGPIVIHPVSPTRIDDWLSFFDHDAFAGNPVDAVCYCTGPHVFAPGQQGGGESRPWRQNRETMTGLLRAGRSFGYLAHVDERPAGWVNASKRPECAMLRLGTGADSRDEDVISVSCFVIAPPYRRHGGATALLRRVLDDAAARNATWVEAYPRDDRATSEAGNFRGHLSMFAAHGFEVVGRRQRDSVLRRRVD